MVARGERHESTTDETASHPSAAGKRVLVTGATSGLGRHVAEQLAASGARVVVHGREPHRTESVASDIRAMTGNPDIDSVVADLASLEACDRLAVDLVQRYDRMDVLVNNAGIGFGAPGSGREESADGIELRFAVNYLAVYRLTRALIPLLITSAPARVVNVCSLGQMPIDFTDPLQSRDYDPVLAYRWSKLAQVMFTFDLAEELRPRGVTVNGLHPASLMDTPMIRQAQHEARTTVDEGGAAVLRLITDPLLDGVTGKFFNGMREEPAFEQAYDLVARSQLRELSENLLAAGLRAGR